MSRSAVLAAMLTVATDSLAVAVPAAVVIVPAARVAVASSVTAVEASLLVAVVATWLRRAVARPRLLKSSRVLCSSG